MKRKWFGSAFISIALMIGILIMGILMLGVGEGYAADKLRNASTSQGHSYGVAIGDISSGDGLEVNSDGAARTQPYGSHTIANNDNYASAAADLDSQIVDAACKVHSIVVTGIATGDWVEIYDGTSRTGTPKYDIKAGTANSTTVLTFDGGVAFSTGVYAYMIDEEMHVAVEYN